MRKAVVGITALVAALGATSVQAENTNAFEGRKLYQTYCFVCHGADGKGEGPLASKLPKMKSLLDQQVAAVGDREMAQMIQGSKPHGSFKEMPKFGTVLGDPDIKAIVGYVRFMERAPYPLMGDPEVGRGVYTRYCVVCHGDNGNGKGVMTHLLPIKPAVHTDAEAMKRLNNQDMLDIIANGGRGKSYMPGFQGVLTDDQTKAVASYIRLLSFK